MPYAHRTRRALVWLLLLGTALLPAAGLAETRQFTQKLHPDMPAFVFTLTYTTREDVLCTSGISVAIKDPPQMIQQIGLVPETKSYDDERLGFELEDMNFDGYTDMRIMAYLTAGADIPYLCWLWDPYTGQFVYNEALSALPSPEFDQANQRIHSYRYQSDAAVSEAEDSLSVESALDGTVDSTYAYQNGALVLVGRTTTTYDMPHGIIFTTIEELIDGQMVVVGKNEERWGGLDEAPDGIDPSFQ